MCAIASISGATRAYRYGTIRISYPMRFTAAHGFADVDTWPVDSAGDDSSTEKSDKRAGLAVCLCHCGAHQADVASAHQHRRGPLCRVPATARETYLAPLPSDADGLDWRKTLSDNNSAYMEVQAGPFRNQETYALSLQTIQFSEWMPKK